MTLPNLYMRIQRGFVWMQEAFGIEHAPDELRTDVQAIIDADQRGWGHADTQIVPFSHTLSVDSPPQTFDLLTGVDAAVALVAPDLSRQIVVLGLSAIATEDSLPGDAWLTYRSGPGGAVIVHSTVSIGTDLAFISGSEVFPTPISNSALFLPHGHLWVPRGYRPQLRIYVYNTIVVTGVAAILRAGFGAGAP